MVNFSAEAAIARLLHPEPATIATLAIAHCAIGLVAAAVAHRKGRSLPQWLAIGLIGGTPSLVAALLLRPQDSG